VGWDIDSNKLSKQFSIRRFITLFLLLALLVSAAISSFWVYKDAVHEVDELFDASLAQTSRVLHGMITRENITENKEHLLASLSRKDDLINQYSSEATPFGHRYEKKISFQVWSAEQELLLKSTSIDDMPLAPFERGFHSVDTEQGHWRAFTLFSEQDQYWLIVGESDEIRAELIHEIALDHSIPVLLTLPALGLLIWFTLSRGFSPLQKVAQQVQTKNYASLSSIKEADVPEEVYGLVDAINKLFDRLSSSYQLEQQFVSNAAHELRNPLASMLIHTENMMEEALNDGDKQSLINSLNHVKSSAQRLSHLVAQLLTLSRADTEIFKVDNQVVDLALISSEVCNDIAKPENTELLFDIDVGHYLVKGNINLIEAMLRNLVDNAVRYSPAGSTVKISCTQTSNSINLIIEDSGPGISEQNRQAAIERFTRLTEEDIQGSGLGMAIVSQIARLHDAQFELDDSILGGLLVRIRFPITHH